MDKKVMEWILLGDDSNNSNLKAYCYYCSGIISQNIEYIIEDTSDEMRRRIGRHDLMVYTRKVIKVITLRFRIPCVDYNGLSTYSDYVTILRFLLLDDSSVDVINNLNLCTSDDNVKLLGRFEIILPYIRDKKIKDLLNG